MSADAEATVWLAFEYLSADLDAIKQEMGLDAPHGTRACYRNGCRESVCVAAADAYRREHSSRPFSMRADAFWAKVDKRGPDECWEWLASKNEKGYGRFGADGRVQKAHRLAYEAEVGPVPAGYQLDHLCRNHGCVNPAHLEPVTSRGNTLRGEGLTAKNAAKTHCVNGHPFDEQNTGKQGRWRRCRACQRKYRATPAAKMAGAHPPTAWVASVGTSHASPGEDATQVRPPAAPAYGRYGPAPAVVPGTVPLTAPLTGGQGRLVWLRRAGKGVLIGLGILAAGLTVAVTLLLILAAAWLLWWPT